MEEEGYSAQSSAWSRVPWLRTLFPPQHKNRRLAQGTRRKMGTNFPFLEVGRAKHSTLHHMSFFRILQLGKVFYAARFFSEA